MDVLEETRQLLLLTLRAHTNAEVPDARAVVLLAREIRALSGVEVEDEEELVEPTKPLGRLGRRRPEPPRDERWRGLRRDTIRETSQGNTPPPKGQPRGLYGG